MINLANCQNENWFSQRAANEWIAAYLIGRLLNALEWVGLRDALSLPPSPTVALDAELNLIATHHHHDFAHHRYAQMVGDILGKLTEFAHVFDDEKLSHDVAQRIKAYRATGAIRRGSEQHVNWLLEIGECKDADAKSLLLDGDETGRIRGSFLSRLDRRPATALNLGRRIDQGMRPVGSKKIWGYVQNDRVDPATLPADPIWYGEVRGLCCRLGLEGEIPAQIFDWKETSVAQIVAAIDELVRSKLMHVSDGPGARQEHGEPAESAGKEETTETGRTVEKTSQVPRSAPTSTETPVNRVSAAEYQGLLKIKAKIDPEDTYIGRSVAILRVFQTIEDLNRLSNRPVLILGPTGSGKTAIASLIHASSDRSAKRFHREQAADNAALDPTLLKGRWTGYGRESGIQNIPTKGQDGLLHDFAGGTIFVDEVADITPEFQRLLIDVLDGQVMPHAAGRSDGVKADVRLIFATNEPFKELDASSFRHDLLRRIRDFQLAIPPLSERREDILEFIKKKCPGDWPHPSFVVPLLRYDWPGNVGQLLDTLDSARSRLRSEREQLTVDHLTLTDESVIRDVENATEEKLDREVYSMLFEIFTAQGFTKGKGMQAHMADFLGVSPSTVSRRMKKYNII